MTIIRVNPESLRAYATFAQQRFEQIRSDLEALTRDVVSVRYFGPNATTFKLQCGELASDFSRALLTDLGRIAAAVSASTSSIAASLGGEQVRLVVGGGVVAVPAVDAGDGSVDVDTSALEALKPVVASRFGSLDEGLSSHLHRLESTDWDGLAKRNVVEQVAGFTGKARARASEACSSISDAIDRQVTSVLAADH